MSEDTNMQFNPYCAKATTRCPTKLKHVLWAPNEKNSMAMKFTIAT
jgi:hypothetical protein